jgi:hypothetical protein
MKRTSIIAAILAVVLAAIGVAIVVGRDGAPKAARPPEGRAAGRPSAAAAGTEGSGAPEAKPGAGGGEVRRLKNKAERERLVAFIQKALAARRAARGEAARGGEEEAGAEGGEGVLSKAVIQEGVRAVIGDIKACYEDALKRTPKLEGRLVAKFEIIGEPDAGGVIESAEIDDATDSALRTEAELTGCIIDSIYTIELPRPEDGGRVTVEYPFYLSPGEDEGK